MNFEFSDDVRALQDRLNRFMDEHVYPLEPVYSEHVEEAGGWTTPPIMDKLKALHLDDHFSVTLCATDFEINAFKPHPAGFLRACEIWDLDPSEVLYIGDRPEVDAAGAQAAGMPCLIIGAKSGANGYCGIPSFEELCHEIENSR